MENAAIRTLEPKVIWKNFADLNAVPRPSKKEEKVIRFMMDFGEGLGLETIKDYVGNVVIRKPATAGMEGRKMVTMQSHLDMVHQKNAATEFDFATQGIQMMVEDDWVKARGTTLGADNGLGVATIMALLESTDIPHPPLEALFTIDEETGMTGAFELDNNLLKGEILLNLDTEEDDEIGVGCAGGVDVTALRAHDEIEVPKDSIGVSLAITGLQGGHSGMDIHKGLGNANKFLARLLHRVQRAQDFHITELDGGSLRNAIPREAFVKFAMAPELEDPVLQLLQEEAAALEKEYAELEPEIKISFRTEELTATVAMDAESQEQLILALRGIHNGVYRMSPDIEDLVETSNNLARVEVKKGNIHIGCLTRSSVESGKWDLAETLRAVFELAGFDVDFSGNYPGWTPNMSSPILKVLVRKYKKLNGSAPHVAACHAGLECGILGQHYPDMDMVSFGPTIKGAHSPDERVSISSVQKYWEFVKEVLRDIPKSS